MDERGVAARTANARDRRPAGLVRHIGDHDARALGGEASGGHPTDPAGPAGDERDLPLEATVHARRPGSEASIASSASPIASTELA